MMEDLLAEFPVISGQVRERRPLLHHITNYVTAGFCADAGLALGALPMMTDAPEEVEAAARRADALVCNLGTFSASHYEAMERAMGAAREGGVPILLDPVGVMTVDWRKQAALKLLQGGVTVLKGNGAEGRALLDWQKGKGKGVDAGLETQPGLLAKALARTYHCVAVITGPVDALSDGKRILYARNGSALLSRITGAGCMTGTVMGAGIAVAESPLAGALWGLTVMNVAAEAAQVNCPGPGTFRARLMDALYQENGLTLQQKFRGEEQRDEENH